MNKLSLCSIAILLALTPVLSGCSNKHIEVTTTQTAKQKLDLPSVDQVLQDPIHWYAVAKNAPAGTKGSFEDFWKQAQSKGYTTGLAITPDEFRKIVKNNARMRKFILQNKALLKAYRKYYEENK